MKLRQILLVGFLSQTFTATNYHNLLRVHPKDALKELSWSETVQISQLLPAKIARFRHFWHKMLLNELPITHLRFLTILDELYPLRLKESYNPPYVLNYLGNLKLLKTTCLGIVGGRIFSPNAAKVVKSFSLELSKNQITVVSGLARGIDTIALTSAIAHGGQVIAVIGSGIAQFYPPENEVLQKNIAQNYLLISEYLPHQLPQRFHFPQRNRIIAGVAHGVLVASARHHSGSLITANLALQNNREVFALPGAANDGLMTGANQLIQAGAKLVLTPQDILAELQYYE